LTKLVTFTYTVTVTFTNYFRRFKENARCRELGKNEFCELQKVLNGGKTVIGQPIVIEGTTLIPLISIGFGFGAGGVEDNGDDKKKTESVGSGDKGVTGGGAGIKPTAIIIIDKNGSVVLESIRGGFESTLEKVAEKVPPIIEKGYSKWKESGKEEAKKES
jgi:uncharacterized spore protein YtfJ